MLQPHAKSIAQKTLIAAIIGALGINLFHLFFWRAFIPSESGILLGLVVALLSVVAVVVLIEVVDRRSGWVSDPMLQFASPLRKVFTWISALALVFFTVWFFIGWPVARIITTIKGEPHSFTATVEKAQSTSYRRRQCAHHVRFISEPTPFLFRFCLSESSYNNLPNGPFVAEFHGHRTALGVRVRNLNIER